MFVSSYPTYDVYLTEQEARDAANLLGGGCGCYNCTNAGFTITTQEVPGCQTETYTCPYPGTCSLTLSPASGSVRPGSTTTFTVTSSCSNISVTSANTSVATVTRSGDTVTVSGVTNGSTTINVTASDPNGVQLSETKTYSISVEDCEWVGENEYFYSQPYCAGYPSNPSSGDTTTVSVSNSTNCTSAGAFACSSSPQVPHTVYGSASNESDAKKNCTSSRQTQGNAACGGSFTESGCTSATCTTVYTCRTMRYVCN